MSGYLSEVDYKDVAIARKHSVKWDWIAEEYNLTQAVLGQRYRRTKKGLLDKTITFADLKDLPSFNTKILAKQGVDAISLLELDDDAEGSETETGSVDSDTTITDLPAGVRLVNGAAQRINGGVNVHASIAEASSDTRPQKTSQVQRRQSSFKIHVDADVEVSVAQQLQLASGQRTTITTTTTNHHVDLPHRKPTPTKDPPPVRSDLPVRPKMEPDRGPRPRRTRKKTRFADEPFIHTFVI